MGLGDGDKTEQPTAKRLDEASQKGQVPYSRELTAAALLLLALWALKIGGGKMADGISSQLRSALSLTGYSEVTNDGIFGILNTEAENVFGLILPFFGIVLIGVAASGYLQIGWSLHLTRIAPHFSKLDPISGFRRLLSIRSVVGVGISLAKLTAVTIVAMSAVDGVIERADALSEASAASMTSFFMEVSFKIAFRVGGIVFAIAIIDFLFQRWRHHKELMMTKEEVQEESKSSEGNPKIKARIRKMMRDVSRARVATMVRKATVVIRNPTHFAVALRYESGRDPAPRVLAKGKDRVALHIIGIAEKHKVPVRSEPALAREIYRTVKVGRTIPEALFSAVAKVLAWVYRQKGPGSRTASRKPGQPPKGRQPTKPQAGGLVGGVTSISGTAPQ